jgi:phenylpyruvate tautomerase PptA (4-oxalocrotonate tautomerase family)
MPIVHIHVARGRTAGQRKAILDGLHAAVVEAFRVPDHSLKQILHEHEPENLDGQGGLEFAVVEMSAFPGRSAEAKRHLFTAVVRNLESAAGIAADNVTIIVHEPPLTNWGVRGGKAAADIDFGVPAGRVVNT